MPDGGAVDGDTPATESGSTRVQAAQRHYDPGGADELTTAIVFAVADAEGVDPSDLDVPPLYECVDAPALEDTFFGPETARGPRQGSGTVSFRYADYLVNVRSDGWIRVFETPDADSPV
ncbi:MAG: HalOD1 output domain-containing protein [Halosimplex sp.]